MIKLMTTNEIAKHFKVIPARIRAIAKARGITPAMPDQRPQLWHASDLAKFQPGPPGRPRLER